MYLLISLFLLHKALRSIVRLYFLMLLQSLIPSPLYLSVKGSIFEILCNISEFCDGLMRLLQRIKTMSSYSLKVFLNANN